MPTGSDMGTLRAGYLGLLDIYDVCAVRHNSTVDWYEQYQKLLLQQAVNEGRA